MRHVEVRCEDELTRLVLIRLTNDRTISVCLEERDAYELVLVLRGYYRLATNQTLPVDQEELPPQIEDLAPPYLSLHKVIPEKWSYISQDQVCLLYCLQVFKNIKLFTSISGSKYVLCPHTTLRDGRPCQWDVHQHTSRQ